MFYATLLTDGTDTTHLSHNLTQEEAKDEIDSLITDGFRARMFPQSKGHEHLEADGCPDCVLDAEREGVR